MTISAKNIDVHLFNLVEKKAVNFTMKIRVNLQYNMKINQYTIRSQDRIFFIKISGPGSAMVSTSKPHKIYDI